MVRWPRPTVRLRLTLTYTALFVVTGGALLGASYILVQTQENSPRTAVQIICRNSANGQIQSIIDGAAQPGSPTPGLNPSICRECRRRLLLPLVRHRYAGRRLRIELGGAAAPVFNTPPAISGSAAAEVNRLTATVKASQLHILNSFRVDSALALGLLTLVAFGLSWWIAGRALRPVHQITDAARSLSEQTLHARINLQGPDDELKQLADTFDAMLGRLDRAFHSQRRFVANASHELRTPLATERVLIDEALANQSASPVELRSILEQLRSNSEETEHLIEALLLLARSERGIEHWSQVELSDAVSTVVDQSSIEAAVAGVTLVANLEPVVVSGDPGLLERLAGNLVENAIRHNLPGGFVWVTTRRDLSTGVLEVINTGPVLDPGAVAGLLEPFRRAGPDRSSEGGGVGLGLSIVNAIVGAHRGTMTLDAREEGGLHVRVQLQVAPSVPEALPGTKTPVRPPRRTLRRRPTVT